LDVLDQFERHFAVSFPAMRHLLGVKLGTDRWTDGVEETFQAYLNEVEQLVDLLDRGLPQSSETAPRPTA
jgi:hypothetical protein